MAAERLQDTTARLVQLYESTGDGDDSAEWRAKLDAGREE